MPWYKPLRHNTHFGRLSASHLVCKCRVKTLRRVVISTDSKGKEQDYDMSGGKTGTVYDYGFRIYNSQIAKFLSVDPLTKDYPSWSPYLFAMNRPINGIDLNALAFFSAFWTIDDLLGVKTGLLKHSDNIAIEAINK